MTFFYFPPGPYLPSENKSKAIYSLINQTRQI